METVKNVKKAATSPAGQFQAGHSPLIQHQPLPGVESKMKPRPVFNQLPTASGGQQPYQPAGKLLDKRALITGGDSAP